MDIRSVFVETLSHLGATSKAAETLAFGSVQLGTDNGAALLDVVRTNGHAAVDGITELVQAGAGGAQAPQLAQAGAELGVALTNMEHGGALDGPTMNQFKAIADRGFNALANS